MCMVSRGNKATKRSLSTYSLRDPGRARQLSFGIDKDGGGGERRDRSTTAVAREELAQLGLKASRRMEPHHPEGAVGSSNRGDTFSGLWKPSGG